MISVDLHTLLQNSINQLQINKIAEPHQKARWLLVETIEKSYSFPETDPHFILDINELTLFEQRLQRAIAGEPIQYILGYWEFYGYEFKVTPDVLIPRPETEELVERIINNIKIKELEDRFTVVDIGTGSGAIIITLYLELKKILSQKQFSNIQFIGSDISSKALHVSTQNALNLNADITWVKSDLLADFSQKIDLLISNPPYISEHDYHNLGTDLKWEPEDALTDHADGTTLYQNMIIEAKKRGIPELYFEIGYDQGLFLIAFAQKYYDQVILYQDLSKRDRILHLTYMT